VGYFAEKLNKIFRNRPFATGDRVVQGPPCWSAGSLLFPHWDIKTKASQVSLVQVSLFLCPSAGVIMGLPSGMAGFVPCGRLLQKVYRWFTLWRNWIIRDLYQNWACIYLRAFLDINVPLTAFISLWICKIRGVVSVRVGPSLTYISGHVCPATAFISS